MNETSLSLLYWQQVETVEQIDEILRVGRSQDRILGQIKLRIEGK